MTWTTLANGDKQTTLTAGNSLVLPADWNPSKNKVECYANGCSSFAQGGTTGMGGNASGVGGGGGGFDNGSEAGSPGGGGAYASEINLGTANQSVTFHVGRPGCPDTWFIAPTTVKAAGATNWRGGSTANSIGSVLHRGGNGSLDGLGGGGGAGPDDHGGDALADGTAGPSGGGLAGAGGAVNGGQTGAAAAGAIVITYTPL